MASRCKWCRRMKVCRSSSFKFTNQITAGVKEVGPCPCLARQRITPFRSNDFLVLHLTRSTFYVTGSCMFTFSSLERSRVMCRTHLSCNTYFKVVILNLSRTRRAFTCSGKHCLRLSILSCIKCALSHTRIDGRTRKLNKRYAIVQQRIVVYISSAIKHIKLDIFVYQLREIGALQ